MKLIFYLGYDVCTNFDILMNTLIFQYVCARACRDRLVSFQKMYWKVKWILLVINKSTMIHWA